MRYIKYTGDMAAAEILPQQPQWFFDDGVHVGDAYLADNDIYPLLEDHANDEINWQEKPQESWTFDSNAKVVNVTYWQLLDDFPEYNKVTQELELQAPSEWPGNFDTITRTYTVIDRTSDQIREYVSSIPVYDPDGFEYDSSTHREKPVEMWVYDETMNNIRRTYWEVIPDPEVDNYSDIIYQGEEVPFELWVKTDTHAQQEIVFNELPVETVKENMYQAAAETRWAIEVGGMTYGTDKIFSDRESQGKFSAVYTLYNSGALAGNMNWKTMEGFVDYTQESFVTLCMAVQVFVKECYDREAALRDQIAAATTTGELIPILANMVTSLKPSNSLFEG